MSHVTPAVPMLAVEPVLMYRASCHCGWWQIVSSDQTDAQLAVIDHVTDTRCSGCADSIDHDSATVLPQRDRAGLYCTECAVFYAA